MAEQKANDQDHVLLKEFNNSKYKLSDTDNGVNFLKDAILASPYDDAEEFADALLNHLDAESRSLLLKDLVVHRSLQMSKKMQTNYDMNKLNPDWEKGAYPYVNPYDKDLYKKQIFRLQEELLKLEKWVVEKKKKVVIIFEGRDAAGKGGTIKRMTENLNPRQARIVALPKPNETQLGQWFFQRYIEKLPTTGEMVFFDRSWYNRAVVEPVMGFCDEKDYEAFMREVPSFEKAITSSGIILFKLWLEVGQEEQVKRFKARKLHPLKRWKLSPVDVESLKKWNDYSYYIQKMFQQTDMPYAPWTIIRSDDKLRARLNAFRVVLSGIDYEGKDLSGIGDIDPLIVSRPIHQMNPMLVQTAKEADDAEEKKGKDSDKSVKNKGNKENKKKKKKSK